MIMIDDNKTVIAGEAIKIMTELATVLDRLISEVSQKTKSPLEYEIILNRFMDLVSEVHEIRDNEDSDIDPNQILDSNKIKKIFPEEFFNLKGPTLVPKSGRRSERSSREESKTTSNLLQEAMRKLEEAKEKKIKKEKKAKAKKKKKDD